jgi:hypothetical protein
MRSSCQFVRKLLLQSTSDPGSAIRGTVITENGCVSKGF